MAPLTFEITAMCLIFDVTIVLTEQVGTERFTGLGKLNLIKFAYDGLVFRIESTFTSTPATSKNGTCFKSGKK